MRATALIVFGICIAAVANAQDSEPTATLPIDMGLEPPALLTVGMAPNTDDFIFLEIRTVPGAAEYITYKEYVAGDDPVEDVLRFDDGEADLVQCCTFVGTAGAEVEELTVIVFAPESSAKRLWAVSAVIGEAQTPLAWGRLAPMPTTVRATSWAAVKAVR